MIVYLQRNFADEGNNESHTLRNTLAVGGALVGGHFAAKGGLLGRHAQRWAGNNHARLGNLFGSTSMFRSGQNAAAEASAKIAYGRLGWLGASKQEQARAIDRARNGETSWTKNLGDGKTKTYEFKNVVQANDNMVNKLAQEKQQKGYEEVKNNRTAVTAKPETTPKPDTKPPATDPANIQKPGAGDTNPNPNPQTDTATSVTNTQQGTGATRQEITDASKNAAANQQQQQPKSNPLDNLYFG